MDPRRLAQLRLGTSDVAQAVASQSPNLPSGTLSGPNRAYVVQADGQLTSAAEFGNLTVAYRNGAPVRLSDVAQVADSVQDDKTASWFGGPEAGEPIRRSITLAVQRQPGTNTVEVADAVKALLPKLSANLPGGVNILPLYDRSETIRESVHDVELTLLLTLVLVVLVVFLFLRSPRATAIPSLALPLSICGTFAVMKALGYSLDNLSLMALTLAVGFVVDDAIVVLENVVRHREMGKDAMTAAYEGSQEVAFTVLSMTLSLAAVFLPLLFMGGIVGRLFREFSVTIAVSILISGVVSLTVTPMLASRFLKNTAPAAAGDAGAHTVDPKTGETAAAHAGAHAGHRDPLHDEAPRLLRPVLDLFERGYDWVHRLYERTLRWTMDHRPTVLAGSAAVLVGTWLLFKVVPTGFLPSDDTSFLRATTEAAQGASYEDMVRHQQEAAEIVQRDPNVSAFVSAVGGGRGQSNQGRLIIRLKDRGDRALDADGVARELTRKLNRVPGLQTFVQNPPTIQIGGRQSKALYQFTMQGTDLDALYAGASQLQERLRDSPQLADVNSDLQLSTPTASLSIDRERAASLGVSATAIEQTLYDAYGSRQVSTIYTSTNQYWVILEVDPAAQRDPDALGLLYVKSNTGGLVPLSAVTTVRNTVGPLAVNHSGQVPSVTVSFNTRPGVSLGQATAAIEAEAREVFAPAAGVVTSFGGTAQAFQSSQAGLVALLVLAVLVIYGILGVLYESFIHPITILSGLPFAVFGALLALFVFQQELSLYAFIGLVLLIGLVKKNAIMMVDFAVEAERTRGLAPRESIFEACLVRFRPITMTTVAALVGTLPIALGLGAGAKSRQPLGIAVVGGLLFSQIVTLYVTPVLYTYFDALQQRITKRRGRQTGPDAGGDADAPAAPAQPRQPVQLPAAASVRA
jgi:HAE1 family hydrophobic/amphiphilic exporter-1